MSALPEPDLSRLHTRLVPRGDGGPPSATPRRQGSRGRARAALFGGIVAALATVAAATGGAALAHTGAEALVVGVAMAGIVVGIGVCVAVATGIWAEAEEGRPTDSVRAARPQAREPRN